MTNLIKNFLNDEAGASAAEYALLLAVIGIGIVVAASNLGIQIGEALQEAADVIDTGAPVAG